MAKKAKALRSVPARRPKKASAKAPARAPGAAKPAGRRERGRVVQMDLFRIAKADPAETAGEAAGEAPADEAPAAAEPPDQEPADREAAGAARAGSGTKVSRGAPRRRGTAPAPPRRRETAESLGRRQREISVAEFFQKNRHLLGFDNPAKALLTATKEAVDNSLDACEEAGILPALEIGIEELAEDRFRVSITDNGPGIVRAQIPRVFGKLLYGSKFHTMRQSRGQQGIGISAAGMYAQLTTGMPVRITSRTGRKKPAHFFEIQIDTAKNEPKVLSDREVEWDREHGTRVEMELAGTYKKGRRSVDDYIVQSALANPHAAVHYRPPKGDEYHRERLTQELPRDPLAIKPHPYGVELGILISMLGETKGRTLKTALQSDFSRVSAKVAEEICKTAGLDPDAKPRSLGVQEIERLFRAIPKVKVMAPPSNVIVPIGEELILEGLKQAVKADFYTATTRPPAVYRGNPFLVEAGLAHGGDMPAEDLIDLWRFANRVPLQYQQSACAITRAALTTDWRAYGLQQGKGALPLGPMVLFVHVASVWVPFTSESKEAVAAYPEIVRELRLGLQECGRRLGGFLRHRRRLAEDEKKRSYITSYIPHIGIALKEILGLSKAEEEKVVKTLTETLERSRLQ
ncbi:MAG TPA: DNA topoisomerase VI subunit B [Candidatus Polarisedimenticolia bacterium]|nr:DNA topoisomerase VI subunit B [Candidatus Polarisedimenticolia bacterium]